MFEKENRTDNSGAMLDIRNSPVTLAFGCFSKNNETREEKFVFFLVFWGVFFVGRYKASLERGDKIHLLSHDAALFAVHFFPFILSTEMKKEVLIHRLEER